MLLCCILSNNMRLYSFLWLTGRVLKKYFGKLFFFSGNGSREQSYEEDRQCRLTTEKGRIIRCYTLDTVTDCCYTLDVITVCFYTLDDVTLRADTNFQCYTQGVVTSDCRNILNHYSPAGCCCTEAGKCGYYST